MGDTALQRSPSRARRSRSPQSLLGGLKTSLGEAHQQASNFSFCSGLQREHQEIERHLHLQVPFLHRVLMKKQKHKHKKKQIKRQTKSRVAWLQATTGDRTL